MRVSGYNELIEFVRSISVERLTDKQKKIMLFLGNEENLSATALARTLSVEIGCSRSAIFNNINSLKRSGLLEMKTGPAIRHTAIGKLVSSFLEVGRG